MIKNQFNYLIIVVLMKPDAFKTLSNQTKKLPERENVPKPVVGQPDSGVYCEDIIDSPMQSDRTTTPLRPSQINAYRSMKQGINPISFTRGKETHYQSNRQATLQLTPNGPKRIIGSEIPYQYDAAPAINRRKDFHGTPMPLRDPQKEYEGPNRFPTQRRGDYLPQTHSTYGMEIQHESHRFGLTTALWPIENRDSKLSDFQPALSHRNPREISRIYADPRQADLVYKIENRRALSEPFRTDHQRKTKLARTSKARRAIQGE